jgi:HSP20 family protein
MGHRRLTAAPRWGDGTTRAADTRANSAISRTPRVAAPLHLVASAERERSSGNLQHGRWDTMRAPMPWTGTGLKREMDRLFERFFESPWAEAPALGEWAPAVDVTENKETITVKAEVPGVDPKEINVSLEGDLLTIKGEKEQKKEEKDERQHRVERTYGAFMRSVRLPAVVDGSKVNATFKNGVVTVTLPKTPGAKGTTIPIKAE